MNWLLGILRVIFTPSCWTQNGKYNKRWDKLLNELMEKNKFVLRTDHTAWLGTYCIWISNHPYASMQPYIPNTLTSFRPRRITILRAHDKLIKDLGRSICPDDYEKMIDAMRMYYSINRREIDDAENNLHS